VRARAGERARRALRLRPRPGRQPDRRRRRSDDAGGRIAAPELRGARHAHASRDAGRLRARELRRRGRPGQADRPLQRRAAGPDDRAPELRLSLPLRRRRLRGARHHGARPLVSGLDDAALDHRPRLALLPGRSLHGPQPTGVGGPHAARHRHPDPGGRGERRDPDQGVVHRSGHDGRDARRSHEPRWLLRSAAARRRPQRRLHGRRQQQRRDRQPAARRRHRTGALPRSRDALLGPRARARAGPRRDAEQGLRARRAAQHLSHRDRRARHHGRDAGRHDERHRRGRRPLARGVGRHESPVLHEPPGRHPGLLRAEHERGAHARAGGHGVERTRAAAASRSPRAPAVSTPATATATASPTGSTCVPRTPARRTPTPTATERATSATTAARRRTRSRKMATGTASATSATTAR
jgi:hypothetical protein